MTKKLLIIIIIVAVAVLAYYLFFSQKEAGEPERESQLLNPAAVYCQEQGGTLENVELPAGSAAYCAFEDGSKCWQWDFYRGDCQKGDLKIETLVEGTGQTVENGDIIFVHYTGWLEDGTKFDSSLDKGQPLAFVLGEENVIKGWDYGILGAKVGEKRRLTIGPSLAYGADEIPGLIPANSTLIFEVEILEIRNVSAE